MPVAFLHLSISLCIRQTTHVPGINPSQIHIPHFPPASDLPVIQLPSPMYAWPIGMVSLSHTQIKLLKLLPFCLSAACLKFTASTWSGWTQTIKLLLIVSVTPLSYFYVYFFFILYSFLACSVCAAASKARAKLNSKRNIKEGNFLRCRELSLTHGKSFFDGSASTRHRKHRGGYSGAFAENWNTVVSIHAMDCSATSPHCLILDKQQREALKTI